MRIRVSPELHFKLDKSITDGIKMSRLIDEAMGRTPKAETDADSSEE